LKQRVELLKDQNQFLNAKIIELQEGHLVPNKALRKKISENYSDQSWKEEERHLAINA